VAGALFTDSSNASCHGIPAASATLEGSPDPLAMYILIVKEALPALTVAMVNRRSKTGSRKRLCAA
jgi:hypothetical protein